MFRAGSIFTLVLALAFAIVAVPRALLAAPDADSAALTEYLHDHYLPAVGAQITVAEDGARSVMLYGFVATQVGFSDAEKRTRTYLHDPTARITNRIRIDPELLALHRNASKSASSGDGGQGAQEAQDAQNVPPPVAENAAPPADVGDIQQYQAQNNNNDPYGMQGQSSVVTGSTLLPPLLGGLLGYGLLSSLGAPSYPSSPPSYYYSPPPPVYYNPSPLQPRHHHHHGSPFASLFAAPSLPKYVPPSFAAPPPVTHSWYSGGYHSTYGAGPSVFGGVVFGGGFHSSGHR